MKHFITHTAKRLVREECGATAVEYGIMIAAIAAIIILTVITTGSEVNESFTYVNGEMAPLSP